MVVKVLAIGDVGNTIRTLRKFVKKSEIHLAQNIKNLEGKILQINTKFKMTMTST